MILFFCSCQEKKTEFFYLESEKSVTNVRTYEHIVIANPPNNLDSLTMLVNEYSNKHLDICKKMRNKKSVWIFFYRETRNTPRDFKSKGDDCWSGNHIGCRTDDIICTIKYGSIGLKFKARKDVYSKWVRFKYNLDCE